MELIEVVCESIGGVPKSAQTNQNFFPKGGTLREHVKHEYWVI